MMSSNLDDGDLIARAQRGEQAAFAGLLTRHQRRLYHFVHRLLGNHADTDDVVQETLVRAFRAIGRFQTPETEDPAVAFQRWLFTIASRRCASLRGRRSLGWERTLDDRELSQLAATEPAPHDILVAAELGRAIREAMARLPARQRVAMVLFEMEGWNVREIAAVLECAPATVKVHLHRARLRLRKELAQYVETQPAEVMTYEMPVCPKADPGLAE